MTYHILVYPNYSIVTFLCYTTSEFWWLSGG